MNPATSPRSSDARRLLGAAALFAILLASTLAFQLGVPRASSAMAETSGGGAHPGIYWGAQIGDQLTGEQAPWDMNAVYKFERLAGKNVSLVSFNAAFASCRGSHCTFNPFPYTPFENLRNHGVIPVFSWSSSSISEGTKDPKFSLAKIIHGRYDGYIHEFARAAAAWGHPFFLRFNWEMNGNWFPWSEGLNGNKPGQYVAAWRHLHDIFTSVGATNATWTWCPNIDRDKKLRELYPGNRYVDWTCLDGYNWGTRWSWGRWHPFKRVFSKSYNAVKKIAPSKPMMIGEVASTDIGGSKTAWVKEMLSTLPKRFPKIRAFLWFEVNDRGTHWPIESSRSVTKAFAKGIRSPTYLGNQFGNLETSPIPAPAR